MLAGTLDPDFSNRAMNDDIPILLVEDNEDDKFFTMRTLAKAGLTQVFHAADGQAAIAYLSAQGEYADREKFPLPEIVLLDLKMPGIDGHEVLEWARTQPALAGVALYALSSSGEVRDRQRAALAHASGYFVKPFTAKDAAAILARRKARAA
jgi:CheY-like chemotaxis protein